MRDGLWGIVDGTTGSPSRSKPEDFEKYVSRKDRALSTIVLSIEPSLLYMIGDPTDPSAVWQKLVDQFQARTWTNRLALWRKLNALHLNDGECVQNHINCRDLIRNEQNGDRHVVTCMNLKPCVMH